MSAGLLERPLGPSLALKDAQQVLGVDAQQGVVRAIVSVTGIVDEVGDLIEPGAYRKTLQERTPKSCDGHDWAKPIGVAVHSEEWLPGDPRLPKQTKDGRPWPKAAGALVCDIQFIMDTDRGLQAFKDVRFYSERNVAEWSIGYQVAPGKATRDAKGIRHIHEVDLYTVDPVLFGAAPLSMTLDVKSRTAHQVLAGIDTTVHLERKGGGDAALHVEGKGDTSPVGTPGGRQNWVDKVGGLPPYIRSIAHALIRNGKSEENAIQIAVGTVKRWAKGVGNVSEETRAKAAAAVAEWEKKKAQAHANNAKSLAYDPHIEVGPYAGEVKALEPAPQQVPVVVEQVTKGLAARLQESDTTLAFKSFPDLPGTVEDRMRAIRDAVEDALYGERDPETDKREWDHVTIDGTYSTTVIASRVNWGDGPERRQTFEIPYSVNDDGSVSLGEPDPVRLVVQAEPVGGEGGDGVDTEWLDGLSDYLGLDAMVGDVSRAVKAALVMAPESKAGRVLSGQNSGLLRQAVEHLIAVLRAAGVEIDANPASDQPTPPVQTPDTTAPNPGQPTAVAGKSLFDLGGELPELPDLAAVLASIDTTLES